MLSDKLESVRIDRWLWAVRICKTRSAATDLCKRQRVSINGQKVKPSREVRFGQLVSVKREGISQQYRVLKCIEKRVGAKVAVDCMKDETSQEEILKMKTIKGVWTPSRDKGAGRPTKKERRAIDKLYDLEG